MLMKLRVGRSPRKALLHHGSYRLYNWLLPGQCAGSFINPRLMEVLLELCLMPEDRKTIQECLDSQLFFWFGAVHHYAERHSQRRKHSSDYLYLSVSSLSG